MAPLLPSMEFAVRLIGTKGLEGARLQSEMTGMVHLGRRVADSSVCFSRTVPGG
jgi:hypothetical protein